MASNQPNIIKKDRSQSVFSTAFLDFQAKMVTGNRIKTGRALVAKHKKLWDRIEADYGVPARC